MADVSTGATTIDFGSNLKIGYKIHGSADSFTYISYHPSYEELPYIFSVPSSGTWDIEYSEICPSCSLPTYSTPVQTIVTLT